MPGAAVRQRRRTKVVGIGEGGLDDRVQAVVADVLLDGRLPGAGIRPDLRAGGPDVGGQRCGVVAVGRLVEITTDPHGATAPPERRLDQVGDVGLPSPRLTTNKHHDRMGLGYGARSGCGQNHPPQDSSAFAGRKYGATVQVVHRASSTSMI